MLNIQVLEINLSLIGERVKNPLEQRRVFISVNPLLVYSWLDLFETKAGVGVECKPQPVVSFYPKITNEESLGCTCQIKHTDDLIDFGGSNRGDWAFRKKKISNAQVRGIVGDSPPEAQINFDVVNFFKVSGLSPSSSTSTGTMLHISIFAWSARESIRFMWGMTPGGPRMQCIPNSDGIMMFIMIPAPYMFAKISKDSTCVLNVLYTHMTHWESGVNSVSLVPAGCPRKQS